MHEMLFDDAHQLSANQALQALTAASETVDGVQVVWGTVGDMPATWPLAAAHLVARHAVENGWDPDLHDVDEHGLVCVHEHGAVYRFRVADPRSAEQRDLATGRQLHVVREAS